MNERLDRRALGAIEFVNALTGTRIDDPLRVSCETLTLVRNPSALYVVREAAGLEAHTVEFRDPPAFAPEDRRDYTLVVADSGRRYLPRAATIKLPRKNAPRTDPESVLVPIAVKLFPAAGLPVGAAWAVLRVRVEVQGTRVGVANALVTLTPTPAGAAAVSAMTDARGEALLAVLGVAPILPAGDDGGGNNGPVLVREFSATLRIVLDGTVARREDAAPPGPVPDPDAIERRLGAGAADVKTLAPPPVLLAAGASRSVVIGVVLP